MTTAEPSNTNDNDEQQIRYLAKLGVGNCADELALEFDDSYVILKHASISQVFSERTAKELSDLDNLLREMSGRKNEELWTFEALASAPKWEEVRRLARTVIALLGQTPDE